MSNPDDRERLESLLENLKRHRRFSEDQLPEIESTLGCVIPPLLRHLWLRFGCVALPAAGFYDAGDISDLLEQYEESGLTGLLPIASDGGSCDFSMDVDGALGLGKETIFIVDRGVMTYDRLRPVASGLLGFIETALKNEIDNNPPDLAARWTETHRSAAYASLPRSLAGLGPDDFDIKELFYRSSVPKALVPRRDIVIDGVPCKASDDPFWDVHLDREGRLVSARLARSHDVAGLPCQAGRTLVLNPDGTPRRFTPASDVVVGGFRWKAGEEIDDSDIFLSGVLVAPTVLDGIPCAAQRVRLDREGRLLEATLAEDHCIDGVDLPAGTWFERIDSPRLYAVRVPKTTRIRGQDVQAGEHHHPHLAR